MRLALSPKLTAIAVGIFLTFTSAQAQTVSVRDQEYSVTKLDENAKYSSPMELYSGSVDTSGLPALGNTNRGGASGQYEPESTLNTGTRNSFNQTASYYSVNYGSWNFGYVTDANGQRATNVDSLHFTNFDVSAERQKFPAGGPFYQPAFFNSASSINDAGQFIAFSYRGGNYLMTPVPEPTTIALMLAGLGVVGVAGRRRAKAVTA
jgi:hypothetical protein